MSGRQVNDLLEYVALNATVVGALFAVNYWWTPKNELTETELVIGAIIALSILATCSSHMYQAARRLSPRPRPLDRRYWAVPRLSLSHFFDDAWNWLFGSFCGPYFVGWGLFLLGGSVAQRDGLSSLFVGSAEGIVYSAVMAVVTVREYDRGRRVILEEQRNQARMAEEALMRENNKYQLESQERATKQERANAAAEAKRRCEAARAECELLYALAAPEIGARFSKQDLNEFLTKYMSDASAPEAVEQRAEQLKKIMREHQAKVEPRPKFASLQELSAWFEQQMAELQSVPDEKLRKSLVVQLKAKYSDLTSAMLSEISQ